MGKTQHQKELLAAYKDRAVVGGVCAVQNTVTGRMLLFPTASPESQRNRFQFSVSTDSPLLPSMGPDWRAHGGGSFTFTCLESLEKKPEQTDAQFQTDLNLLAELWRDRLEGTPFY